MHTLKFLHEALTKSNLFCGYAEQVLANLCLPRSHSISQDTHTGRPYKSIDKHGTATEKGRKVQVPCLHRTRPHIGKSDVGFQVALINSCILCDPCSHYVYAEPLAPPFLKLRATWT